MGITMARYIKKFKSTLALGPTEERGFALWVGYQIEGISGDQTAAGLVNVDDWSEDQLRERGVSSFTIVTLNDHAILNALGLEDPTRSGTN
jgi:hypothetical protein